MLYHSGFQSDISKIPYLANQSPEQEEEEEQQQQQQEEAEFKVDIDPGGFTAAG